MARTIVFMVVAMLALTAFLVPWDVTAQSASTDITGYHLRQLTHQDTVFLEKYRSVAPESVTARIWALTLDLNKQYPNPNILYAGNIVYLPLGFYYPVTSDWGGDHMWQAAQTFDTEVVWPYLHNDYAGNEPNPEKLPPPPPVVKQDGGYPWGVMIIVLGLVALFLWWYHSLREKKPKAYLQLSRWKRFLNLLNPLLPDKQSVSPPPTPERPPFVKNPPIFGTPEFEQTAQSALSGVYGPQFTIVPGSIREVTLNAEQIMFWRDGTTTTQKFENEPGFIAILKFDDGKEYEVASRMRCFNPVWGARGAQLRGTYTLKQGDGKPVELPIIDAAQVALTSSSIRAIAEGKHEEMPGVILPSEAEVKPKSTNPEDVLQPTEEKLHFTKVQVSQEKGLNLEGEFDLTVTELRGIIAQVTGKQGGKKAKKS